MTTTRITAVLAFALGCLCAAAPAFAQRASAPAQHAQHAQHAQEAAFDASLSPKARGELARQFVLRWADHVERVYDVRAAVWARRMVPTFATADPDNFRNALNRATFEGATAELSGRGQRLSDRGAISRLARAAAGAPGEISTKALGSIEADLVYTPVQPCRIVDTRNVAAGPIAGNASRNFLTWVGTGGNFVGQGGSATDCNMANVQPSAVAINVTAVTPSAAGFATVYPFGTTQPLTSSVNYTAGAIVNNAIVAKLPNPVGASDITLYTFAQAHYVVDIVGYFAPPRATRPECTGGNPVSNIIAANAQQEFNNPACPAGYVATLPFCLSMTDGVYMMGSGFVANSSFNNTFCRFQNTTATPQTVFGATTCCRIPGR